MWTTVSCYGPRVPNGPPVFRNARTGEVALYYRSEGSRVRTMTWDELSAKTAARKGTGVTPLPN